MNVKKTIFKKDRAELTQTLIVISGLAAAAVTIIGILIAVLYDRGEETAHCINGTAEEGSNCAIINAYNGSNINGSGSNPTPGDPIENEKNEEIDNCFVVSNGAITRYLIEENPISCGTDVNIPAKINGKIVTAIADKAFSFNSDTIKITSVTFPDTIETIGQLSFANNAISGKLILPESVEKVAHSAFYNNNISQVDLPDGLREIEYAAFENNTITGEVKLPKKLVTLGSSSFENNSISSISWTDSLQTLEYEAFRDNKITGHLTIPDSITSLETQVFRNNNIESITFPDELKAIKRGAFAINNLQGEIIVPQGVENIEETAFSTNDIHSIVFPDSVKHLPANVVYKNDNIAKISYSSQTATDGFFYKGTNTEIIVR